MQSSGSLEVISGADSSLTVLCVDFAGKARREAGFAELAARMGPGYRFLQTKPLITDSRRRLSGEEYIDLWAGEIRRDPNQVLAVLGYRVGSAYAASIAEKISRWQPEPLLILFDPQRSSIDLLESEFRREINGASSLLSDDEIERAGEIVAMIAASEAEDLVNVADEMVERYLTLITVAFERSGLGDIRRNKLSEPFRSYISWISAARAIAPVESRKSSTAIVSSDYVESPDQKANNIVGRRIAFDVARADLLRSNCTAQAVLELLASL